MVSFVYLLTSFSVIGAFLFGYDTGVISGALVLIDEDFNMTDIEKELIVGITVGGAMISALLSGASSDYFGRKPVIVVSSMIFVVGSFVMCFAPDYLTLLIGRFIVGLGVGSASMCMPIYVGEAAPIEIRGILITCIQLSITFGQLIASLIAGAFSTVDQGWRYMLGLAALPAMIQFIGFLYLPESPRWLMEHDKEEEAIRVLIQIRDGDDVTEEVETIKAAIAEERQAVKEKMQERREIAANKNNNKNSNKAGKGNCAQHQEEGTDFTPRPSSKELVSVQSPFEQSTAGNHQHYDSESSVRESVISGRSTEVGNSEGFHHDEKEEEAKDGFAHAAMVNDALVDTPASGFRTKLYLAWLDSKFVIDQLFYVTTTRRALIVGCLLQASQQLSAVNTIMYYSATILRAVGFTSTTEAIWLASVVAFFNFIGTFTAFFFVEKYGRRPLGMTSLFGVIISLLLIAMAYYIAQTDTMTADNNSSAISGSCSDYKYCFDCIQDTNCAFCSELTASYGGGSACIRNEDDDNNVNNRNRYRQLFMMHQGLEAGDEQYSTAAADASHIHDLVGLFIHSSMMKKEDYSAFSDIHWSSYNSSAASTIATSSLPSSSSSSSYFYGPSSASSMVGAAAANTVGAAGASGQESVCTAGDYTTGECPGSDFQGGWLIFVFLCVYLLCFTAGMGPMPWVINAEIYPTHIRGSAVSLATATNWLMNLLISLTFLTSISYLSFSVTFVCYAAVSFALLVFFLYYLPETRGLPLEEVSRCFEDGRWGKEFALLKWISKGVSSRSGVTAADAGTAGGELSTE